MYLNTVIHSEDYNPLLIFGVFKSFLVLLESKSFIPSILKVFLPFSVSNMNTQLHKNEFLEIIYALYDHVRFGKKERVEETRSGFSFINKKKKVPCSVSIVIFISISINL